MRTLALLVTIFILAVGSGCASKKIVSSTSKTSAANGATAGFEKDEYAPGATPFKERKLSGKAFAIGGEAVSARELITSGESHRGVFLDPSTIVYSSRRSRVDRWQVFAADLTKKVERRVSFDAGDAEPVAILGLRLVVATTSDERKSGERVLNRYQEIFIPRDDKTVAPENVMQHLLLEHPALGRKGTEWNRISHFPAQNWILSADRETKKAVILAVTNDTPQIFRATIIGKPTDPSIRQWLPIQVAAPEGVNGKIIDGRILPDGTRAVWSNGVALWTTTLTGTDPQRIGETLSATSIAVDPSGRWIVFSSRTEGKELDLKVIHITGRCFRNLTELDGDEFEPTFSPDGQRLLFTHKLDNSSAVAEIPFGDALAESRNCDNLK